MNWIVTAANAIVCEGDYAACVQWITTALIDKKDDRTFNLYHAVSTHKLTVTQEVTVYE